MARFAYTFLGPWEHSFGQDKRPLASRRAARLIAEKQVTFAYKDVHFINPECGADGTWRMSLEALTTIAHGLHTRKVHAPIVALNPYGGMEPAPAVPTMKE